MPSEWELPGLELTPAQKSAATEFLQWWESPEERILLWAACGAGKTEVCFPLIRRALRAGARVLFTAPRQDVIHDVQPRLENTFADVEICAMTGELGSPPTSAPLIAATTHQALKFYQAFDLIIFDEIDAFPYKNSSALRFGLEQAGKPGCKRVLLTATPAEEHLSAGIRTVRLPARHHRQPLPVPVFQGPRGWQQLLERLQTQGPVLLFVPLVRDVAALTESLQSLFPQQKVSGSYSSDPERTAKVAMLKAGGYNLFVSTMILERGVTIPGVQVVVTAADHANFDTATLVQLAGRAGRTAAQPTGEVVFLAKKQTKAMKEARRRIAEQNYLAEQSGLIDGHGAWPKPRRKAPRFALRALTSTAPLRFLRAVGSELWYEEASACAICGQVGTATVCPACVENYFLPEHRRCAACGKITGEKELCQDCSQGLGPQGLSGATSLGWYKDGWRDYIRDLKYGGQPFRLSAVTPFLKKWALSQLPPPELLVPVPLHREKLKVRGFNQAEVMASLLGGFLGVRTGNVLERSRYTRLQAGLSRNERFTNVQGAFTCFDAAAVRGKSIWLLDDVLTTGATMAACGDALLRAGASEVAALTLGAGYEGGAHGNCS
jgi:ComF family protein